MSERDLAVSWPSAVSEFNNSRSPGGINEFKALAVSHVRPTRATNRIPIRRVLIPKADGKLRPLGISTCQRGVLFGYTQFDRLDETDILSQ
jgi:hypothetical protein